MRQPSLRFLLKFVLETVQRDIINISVIKVITI
jgi:hypothetical protein